MTAILTCAVLGFTGMALSLGTLALGAWVWDQLDEWP